MEAVLLVVGVLVAFYLAARRMLHRWDPPYQGLHERRGRHRRPDWQG